MRLLLVGETRHVEFREAVDWLQDQTHCIQAAHLDEARRVLMDQDDPIQAIVFAQPRRACFSQEQIESLRRVSPLSVMISLCGSWCEGELQTGRPLAGVRRVIWSRWRGLAADLAVKGSSLWQAPHTATAAEILDNELGWQRVEGQPAVVVVAHTVHSYQPIAGVLESAGYATHWMPRSIDSPIERLAAVVWCDQAPAVGLPEFIAVRDAWPDLPVVAVIGFPRMDDIIEYTRAGAREVLGKPFRAIDLLDAVQRHIRRRRRAA